MNVSHLKFKKKSFCARRDSCSLAGISTTKSCAQPSEGLAPLGIMGTTLRHPLNPCSNITSLPYRGVSGEAHCAQGRAPLGQAMRKIPVASLPNKAKA